MYYDMRPPHHYRSRPAEDLRRYQGASVFFFFGPSSSRRDGVILFVSMDGKSPRLAASAVSVVVAASIMLLTQRPRLGRIFSESVPLLCCEHEENSGTSWMKDSGRSGVSSRVGRTHPSICRAQNVETEKPKVKRAHCDLSATYLCILTESHITPTTPPLSTLFGDG